MEHCRSLNGTGLKFARVSKVINADRCFQDDVIASSRALELGQASPSIQTPIGMNFRFTLFVIFGKLVRNSINETFVRYFVTTDLTRLFRWKSYFRIVY